MTKKQHRFVCEECGSAFFRAWRKARFCSAACMKAWCDRKDDDGYVKEQQVIQDMTRRGIDERLRERDAAYAAAFPHDAEGAIRGRCCGSLCGTIRNIV